MSERHVPILAVKGHKPEMQRFLEKVRVYSRHELLEGASEREVIRRLREKRAPITVGFYVEREHLRLLGFNKSAESLVRVLSIALACGAGYWAYQKMGHPVGGTIDFIVVHAVGTVGFIAVFSITVVAVSWLIKQLWKLKKIDPVQRGSLDS